MTTKEEVSCGLCGRNGVTSKDHFIDFKVCTDCNDVIQKKVMPRGFW